LASGKKNKKGIVTVIIIIVVHLKPSNADIGSGMGGAMELQLQPNLILKVLQGF